MPAKRPYDNPRGTFTLTLTAYLLLRTRNGLQRVLLAHGRRAGARGQFYPRDRTGGATPTIGEEPPAPPRPTVPQNMGPGDAQATPPARTHRRNELPHEPQAP